MPDHKVKFNAISHVVAVSIGTGLTVQKHETIVCQDQSGAFRLQIPRQLIPFAEIGDELLLSVTFTKGVVEETSNILKPTSLIKTN